MKCRPTLLLNAKLFAILLLLSVPGLPAFAQEIKLSGYVKAENIYDTRQVVAIREGQFNLFPLAPSAETGTDNLVFAAFQSRLNVTGSGTRALGAQASGVLEADFFGTVNANLSTLRLRHAYVKLDWQKADLILGQYWSPLFPVNAFPQTVSFNTGAPFEPFAIFPQVRVTWKPGNARITGAFTQQRDAYAEISGNKTQQQAALPAAHLALEYGSPTNLVGASSYVKSLRPDVNRASFTTGAVNVFGRIHAAGLNVRGMVIYGSDLVDHLMTGGYVSTTDGQYVPLRAAAGWIDVETSTRVSAGIFAGYLANLGAGRDVSVQAASTRADDIAYVWRVSPRFVYNAGKVRIAAELEATSALYAPTRKSDYRPSFTGQDRETTNLRGLFAAYYFF